MNQIEHINLGGHPFHIDLGAMEKLDKYIQSLERYFSKEEAGEDILTDIEYRLAELFNEKMESGRIVTQKVVTDSIVIMGTPEDIYNENEKPNSSNRDRPFKIKTGRRLFRDPEDKMIGGVCSGLAQYFGIEDPVWIRGLFALIFFAGGSGFLAYIILMMVMPKAQTAADHLAMQGEPINIDSIARTVQDQFDDLENKFHEFKNK